HHTVRLANISVTVYYSFRDNNGVRVFLADEDRDHILICRRIRAVIPQPYIKGRRPDETKQVCLVDMFVRPALHPALGKGDVRHSWISVCAKIILPDKLCLPPPVVEVLFERVNANIFDNAPGENRLQFGLCHKLFAPDSATILEALSRLSKVPASVHHP